MKYALYRVTVEGKKVFEELKTVRSRIAKKQKNEESDHGDAFCFCYAQPRSRFGDVMLSGVLRKECAFGELAMLTSIKTRFLQKSATWTCFPIIRLADFMLKPLEIPSCVLDA